MYLMPVYKSSFYGKRLDESNFTTNPDHAFGPPWAPLNMSIDLRKLHKVGPNTKWLIGEGGASDQIPFTLVWMVVGSGVTRQYGCIEIDYDITFHGVDSDPEPPNYGSVRVDSTDAAALGLNAATELHGCVGLEDDAKLITLSGTNEVTFNSGHSYKIDLIWTGTNPVSDIDGHTVQNNQGSDVTAQVFRLHASENSDAGAGHSFENATASKQTLFVDAAPGDKLTIDTLTSGSITSFMMIVSPWGHDSPYATTT